MSARDKKKLREKKRKFFQKIKKRLENNEDIDEEAANEYAEQWFAIADTDGNGLIDEAEFAGFVEKIDEKKTLSDQEVKNQFDNHDTNERKSLDKMEFGVALHQVLLLLKNDLANAAEGEDDD